MDNNGIQPVPGTVRDHLRGALAGAMRARDRVAVSALRSALAAIDNAEAVDLADLPEHQRRYTVGQSADVTRRLLTEEHMNDLVRAEITDRRSAADDYERAGHRDVAERLRTEADVLGMHVDLSPG